MPNYKPAIKMLVKKNRPLVELKAPTVNAIFASRGRQRTAKFVLEVKKVTKGDVLAKVLAEVTGHSQKTAEELLETFKANFDGLQNFDVEMTVIDAQSLFNDLMHEKDGIRAWLLN